jgi:hypothetical protein
MTSDGTLITLPEDLTAMVKRWTADGTMRFRWPTDDERNFKHSGDRWGGDVEWELRALDPEKDIKAALAKNEGPAIDAFAQYWRDVPARNVNDLITSFKVVSVALLAVNAALIAYKHAMIESLTELKKNLDDNEKWAWLPWSDDHAIHDRAVKLIQSFDESADYTLQNFRATVANASGVIKREGQLYDAIVSRFTEDTKKTGDKLASF